MNLGQTWIKIESTKITRRWILLLSLVRSPGVINAAWMARARLLCALLLTPAGCHSPPQPQIHSPVMSPPDPIGASAFIGPFFSSEEFPDSPKPPNSQWRGVL